MSPESFKILTQNEVQQWLKSHIDEDPTRLALSSAGRGFPPREAFAQLKVLQKARYKLPSYFEAQCLIPERAYEQSSSERAASLKNISGLRGLDLCCGLGVDSLYFSRHFSSWTCLEAQADLARVTAYNFQKLGADNVKLLAQTAEDFLQNYTGPTFDLMYADPDRRNEQGKRIFLLEDCRPNLISLLPLIKRCTSRLLIKASPLFDLAEAERQFPELAATTVVSLDDECKEVWIDLRFGQKPTTPVRKVRIDRRGNSWACHFEEKSRPMTSCVEDWQQAGYLFKPDVAFYKARRTRELFDQQFPLLTGGMNHPEGYFFSQELPEMPFPGRIYRVLEWMTYKPKLLKKRFGKSRINIARRNFSLSVKEIRKATGIQEGGTQFLFCTEIEKQKICFYAEPVSQ